MRSASWRVQRCAPPSCSGSWIGSSCARSSPPVGPRRERSPRLRRSIDLRTPYVDTLSQLQVHVLRVLRSGTLDGDDRAAADDLLQLTVSGVAAGIQHTR